jgi:hypothetical protein
MKNSRFALLFMLCWVFMLTPMLTSAQVGGPGDTDGDGVSDSVDRCPTRPGPTVSMGCPDTDGDSLLDDVDLCPDAFGTVQSGGCPDSDGDGVLDNSDACPTQGGPDTNRGCPVEQPAENPVPENTINPVRPVPGGACTVATFLNSTVNVREYPSPDAPIIGTIDPAVLYEAYGVAMIAVNTWYAVDGGWVSGTAVVLGGDCGGLVRVTTREIVINDLPQRPTHGIVPEQECVDVVGLAVPFCYMVLTAYADDDRNPETQGLQPETECVEVAGLAVPFCYLKLVAYADDDNGATSGLQPEMECVEVVGLAVPHCYMVLVAYADDGNGSTNGLQPETKCVDILGKNFCYLDFVAYAPDNDGSTNGLVPETKCVDVATVAVPFCYMELVAYADDDNGATNGLVPQTKCVDIATTDIVFCYLTWLAVPNDDGQTSGLQPETKCVEVATVAVPYCYMELVAYADDDNGATSGLQPETECVEILNVAVPFCYLILTASVDDDGATSGLVPETECVDLAGQNVCYLKLTAYAPEDDGATSGLSPENRCVVLAGSSEYFCYTILVGRLPDDSNAVPVNTGDGGVPSVFDPNSVPTCDEVRDEMFASHGSEWRREGDYAVQYLIINPDVPLPEPRPCVQTTGGIVSEGQGYGFTSAQPTTTQTREHILLARQVGYASWPPNGWEAFDLTDGEEPVQALLLPAVQKVREAARRAQAAEFYDNVRTAREHGMGTYIVEVDFFGQSATDADGNMVFVLNPGGGLEAAFLKLGDIKGE